MWSLDACTTQLNTEVQHCHLYTNLINQVTSQLFSTLSNGSIYAQITCRNFCSLTHTDIGQ